jgi:hypothetical protein
MVENEYQELNKITLVGWVEKIIDQLLTKDNISSRFNVINIRPLNLKVMDKRTQLLMIYTKKIAMNREHSCEDRYILRD